MNWITFLTYLLIAGIVALAINILFRMSCEEEHMSNFIPSDVLISDGPSNYQKHFTNEEAEDYVNNVVAHNAYARYYTGRGPKPNCWSGSPIDTDSDMVNGMAGGHANKTPNLVPCINCDYENTFSKEFIQQEAPRCPTSAPDMTREQLKDYRDKFFGFRSELFQGSNVEGTDPVDKINEQLLDGEGELVGRNISDVFDSLTGNKSRTQQMKEQNVDNITMNPQYKSNGANGQFYLPVSWAYTNESVMNGGKFYDGVSGIDSELNPPMAIDY